MGACGGGSGVLWDTSPSGMRGRERCPERREQVGGGVRRSSRRVRADGGATVAGRCNSVAGSERLMPGLAGLLL